MNATLEILLKTLNIKALGQQELKPDRIYIVTTEDIPLVVKFTPLSWAVDEVFFLQSLETNFIPHPKLLHFGKLSDEIGYLVTEYMPNAVDTLNNDLRADANFWRELATGLQKINSIPVEGFGFNRSDTFGIQNFTSPSFLNFIKTILQELSDKLQNSPYSKLVDELKSKQSNLIEKEQAYLVHGDFGGNNYLWYPDTQKIYFFDAGYVRGMPKTWDIAYFGWRIDPERVTDADVITFTDHYFEQTPDDYTNFEIAFFKSLIALMKISDGYVNKKVDEKHVAAAHLNLMQI